MKLGLKTLVIYMVLFLFFVSLPVADAKSVDLQIEVAPETVYASDVFTVTVTFTSTGEAMSTLTASIKYDDSKMQYLSGGGNAVELSNGSGGISQSSSTGENTLSYNLKFRALKTGSANFSVTNCEVIGISSGGNLGSPTLSKTIAINKYQENGSEESPLEITLDGQKLYITSSLSNIDLPTGYEINEISYNNTKIEAAYNPALGLTLINLADETGTESFYIYDSAANSFFPYISITAEGSYAVLPPPAVPKGYTLSTAAINGIKVPVCVQNFEGSGFYLLYAINPLGETGYYLYDAKEGTIQRAITDEEALNGSASSNAVQDVMGTVFILAAICAVLSGLMVWLASNIKSRNNK